MNASTLLSHELIARFQGTLEAMYGALAGAMGCVVATVDGRLLNHVVGNQSDPQRIAAMLGAMVALGETIGREVRIERTEYLVVQGGKGLLLMQRVPSRKPWLVVAVLVNEKSNVGVTLYHTRKAAAAIASAFDEWIEVNKSASARGP